MRRRCTRTVPARVQRKCTEPVASSSDLPTDHRRSDNHSESHQPQTLRTRCIADTMRSPCSSQGRPEHEIVQFPSKCRRLLAPSHVVSFPLPKTRAHENAPSRWRLRPASRLTSAEAAADRRAINLGRSVLGASRTLGSAPGVVKASGGELFGNCAIFFSRRVRLHLAPSALQL